MPQTRMDPVLLVTIAADAATLERAAFLQKYARPVLLAVRWRESAWGGSPYGSTVRHTRARDTDSDKADAPCWELPATTTGRVALGRAPDNDIVIPEPNVSKWHLEFLSTPAGWSVRDMGSRNCTWVDDQSLPPGMSLGLQSGQTLLVGGGVRLRFLSPAGLWDFLTLRR